MSNAGKREMGPKCGSLPRNAGELAGLYIAMGTPWGSPSVRHISATCDDSALWNAATAKIRS